MEILKFEIKINASPEKVWSVLWSDFSYRQWSSAFTKGSYYLGNWDEGSIVKFLDPNENGMYSRIIKNEPNVEMTILHLGEVYGGIETPQDWGDATESYVLEEKENQTILKVTIKSGTEFKDFFEKKFPSAMQNVKNLAENQL